MEKVEKIIGIHLDLPKNLINNILNFKKLVDIEYSGNYNFNPHITLYLSKFPDDNFDLLCDKFKDLKLRSLNLQVDSLDYNKQTINQNKKFYFLKISETKEILLLHKKVVSIVNELRKDMIRTKDLKRIENQEYSEEEVYWIMRYGYLRVLKNFNPHITLGNFYNSELNFDNFKKLLTGIIGQKFAVTKLVIGLYNFDLEKKKYLEKNKEIIIRLK